MSVKVKEKIPGSGIFWIFVDHQGMRRAKKVGPEDLARKAARKIEAKLILGDLGFLTEKDSPCPTLKEYVNGWQDPDGYHVGWMKRVAELRLKNSTRKGYQSILDKHVLPAFGNMRIDQISSRQVSDYIYKLFKTGLRSGTIKNIKNCLSAILESAREPDRYIKDNPARGIEIPVPEDEVPAREPNPFTWKERDKIEKTFREHFARHYPFVVCGFRAGLRMGELIGLKKTDVDYFNRLLSVERNITRGKVTTPKSHAGRRQVRMTTQLVEILQEQEKRILEERELRLKMLSDRKQFLAAKNYPEKLKVVERRIKKDLAGAPEWLFVDEDGNFLNYGNFVSRIWNEAIKKAGLGKRTPHDMRHTYATLRLSKGDSLAEVSKEMGHGTPDITFRTYYKWLPKESRSDIDELDARPATGRNLSATGKKKGVAKSG